MRWAIILFGLLFCSISLFAQNSDQLYNKVNCENYDKSEIFNQPIDFKNINYAVLNAAVFHETNKIRNNRKINLLEYHPLLEKSSDLHAISMVQKNYFNHINEHNQKLREPNDRAKAVGIKNPNMAENIAEIFAVQYKSGMQIMITPSGEKVNPETKKPLDSHTYHSLAVALIDQWMHSPPHKKNILAKEALQLGCGLQFYTDEKQLDMPMFKAVQNFQWHYKIEE